METNFRKHGDRLFQSRFPKSRSLSRNLHSIETVKEICIYCNLVLRDFSREATVPGTYCSLRTRIPVAQRLNYRYNYMFNVEPTVENCVLFRLARVLFRLASCSLVSCFALVSFADVQYGNHVGRRPRLKLVQYTCTCTETCTDLSSLPVASANKYTYR
jgi:hypothetical protein